MSLSLERSLIRDGSESLTIESLQQVKKNLFEKIEDAKRNNMSVDKKISWLKQMRGDVEKVVQDGFLLEQLLESKMDELPWHSFEKRVYRCVGVGTGELSTSLVSSKAIQVGLTSQMKEVGQRELTKLDQLNAEKDPQTMPILHLYHLIGELQPQDKRYLKGFAERLMIEEAYSEAIKVLEDCLVYYPDDKNLLQKKIVALQGIGKYQVALDAIRDCKLNFSAYEDTSKAITPEIVQLENIRVDCLSGSGKDREAREVLEQLIKELPKESYFKRKMVLVSITEALRQYNPKNDQFFLERTKKQFSQLDAYAHLVWTEQSMESDLNFWLFVLSSNPMAVENEEIFTRVQFEVHRLVENGMVSTEAVEVGVKKIADVLVDEVAKFKEQLQRFLQETSLKEVPFSKNIQEAIREARLNSMKTKIYGEKNTGNNAGILNKIKIIRSLLDYFKTRVNFQESQQRTFLHNINHAVVSAESELNLCLRGLKEICNEGYHPWANLLADAIVTNKQLPASEPLLLMT